MWNGKDLVDEYAALLGDTSDTFKSRVLGWINDVQDDILTRHDWDFLKRKGQKNLVASEEEQDLFTTPPGAPTVALVNGGSLIESSVYEVAVTFYESVSGYETPIGTASSSVTPTATDKQINVSDIPIGTEPLTNQRKVYLRKDSGSWLFIETITDNTTTTTTIDTDSTSTIEPPAENSIRKLLDNPFLNTNNYLTYKPIGQLRLLFQGRWSTGTPDFWSDMGEDRIILYPITSDEKELSFYYYIRQHAVVYSKDSQPLMPSWLKPALRAGVIFYGFEYRDRDGTQEKGSNYESILANIISRKGSSKKTPLRVRDTMGDSDGDAL